MPALSSRTARLHASPIREILAVIDRPGMVSFAGGLPSPDSFPAVEPGGAPAAVLQYGPTEGEPALRDRIAANLRSIGMDCTADQVLVLSGSQQGIDLVGKLFIDAGTRVAVESPTYLAALQVFRYYGADFVPLGPARDAAFAYVIPTFQNPTGHCYSAAERQDLARLCDESGMPLFEDDPYRDLVYDACDRTPVASRLRRAPWIYQGSFSKSFAPGLRLGYLAASPEFVPLLVRLKQAADLHSNRLSQWLILRELQDPGSAARLERLAAGYRVRRDAFAAELHRHFSGIADWAVPPGGLFFWLRLRAAIDTRELLSDAIGQGVAFMPGEAFFPDPADGVGTMRLNFSHAGAAEAARGLRTLARLVTSASASAPSRRSRAG
ncbi:MAG: PLP-dependent aminotransferase family protein [Proteobacteria bacterium]|nr:PLP-dependent aminotransferase family protein [Pseudomonadota bacterium]